MDRATVFIFPLMLAALQQAWNSPIKRNISKAAITVGAAIHFQVYYALYAAVVIPVYSLVKAIQEKSGRSVLVLVRIAPLALVIALPAYWVLQVGSLGSYQLDHLSVSDPSSISFEQAQRFLQSPDHSLPTKTAQQRLLSATKGALSPCLF